MVDRIKVLCKAQGTSVTKLEEALGFGNGTIGKWKNAKNAPPADKLQRVADVLGVSSNFLLTGKEKPTGNADGRDYKDIELLEAFERADEATREAIRLLLKLK